MKEKLSFEEKLFHIVATYLFKGSSLDAEKEFAIFLFADWAKTNLDTILEAITNYSNNPNNP
ncbi:hypothetical protein [Candidatus Hodarchaeum mangrovi]